MTQWFILCLNFFLHKTHLLFKWENNSSYISNTTSYSSSYSSSYFLSPSSPTILIFSPLSSSSSSTMFQLTDLRLPTHLASSLSAQEKSLTLTSSTADKLLSSWWRNWHRATPSPILTCVDTTLQQTWNYRRWVGDANASYLFLLFADNLHQLLACRPVNLKR